jgi:hypothetical protein
MEDDPILNIFVDDPLTNNLVPFEYSLDLKKSKTKFLIQKTNYQINLQTAISNAIVSQAPNFCVRLKNSNKPQIISHKPDK